MSKCKLCQVEILDNTGKCPLCHHVIERNPEPAEPMYPDLREVGKKYRMLENIFLYVSLVVWAILFYIDYMTGPEYMWSFPVGLAIIYANVLLRLTILGKSPHMTKIVWTILIALACLLEADFLTGNHGWGWNFAFPTAVACLDVGILILMLFVNRKNWQRYLSAQIAALAMCVIMLLLIWTGQITFVHYAVVVSLVTFFMFLGTVIIGDRKAGEELKRRFHF